jgi:hypothetical protein
LTWELICLPLCKSEAALLLLPLEAALLLLPLETVRYLTESWHVGWLKDLQQPTPWRPAYEFSTLGSWSQEEFPIIQIAP